ncbi:hypothetical protein GCM10023261_16720 [Bartonella jaculi]|uniref:Uncharacterized protein n=1 Tax=Bartonella jaculi TaxID=686226 RepID=A0ABP9NCA1_9HYPH
MKGVVFFGIVAIVLGVAHVGEKHMGITWFVFANDEVFESFLGLLPFFAYEGVRCVGVLWDWFWKQVVFVEHSK